MPFISLIYNEILYKPLFNGLIFLYNNLPGHDFGIAIIVLTALIRLLFYPLFQKSMKAQKEMSELQPKIKEAQVKYKNDKEKQARVLMELYKEHKVNPMSGCLPLIIQIPILFAFFQVLRTGLDPARLSGLYKFVENPGAISSMFLGVVDLAIPNVVLAFLTGLTQFIQAKMMSPKNSALPSQKSDFATAMNKQMTYFMPIFIFLIALKFPAGLALYWTVLNIFGVGQQYFIQKKGSLPKNKTAS